MKSDLDKLKTDIQEYVKSKDIVVFHGYSRLFETPSLVSWDVDHYPDYKEFLGVAEKLDVSLITFHHRELTPEIIDDSLDDLESIDLPSGELSRIDKRLHELRVYEGFTSVLELSFVHQGQTYIYVRRADWYDALLEITDEIDDYLSIDEGDEDETDVMGGYFSKN